MPRPAVVVALPTEETAPVAAELKGAGFEAIPVAHPDQLEALLRERRDIAVAVLDGETDLDSWLEYYSLLHEDGRSVAALMVVSPRALERFAGDGTSLQDEYLTRPYSADPAQFRECQLFGRLRAAD